MSPLYRPLLDRGARARACVELDRARLDPAGDFLLATPFNPGRHAVPVPRPAADVLRHLVSVEHVVDPANGRVHRRRVPLVVDDGERVRVPWGLVPLLAQAARVRAGDPRPAAPAVPPVGPLAGVTDPLVAAALLARRRLVVRHGRGVDVAAVLAGLAAAFPDRRIAVVATRRRDVGHLTAGLAALGVDAGGFYSAADYVATPPRVAVGTPAALTSMAAWHAGCSVVVVLDAVHFVGQGGVSARFEPAWLDACWIGLLPADRRSSPLERDRMVCFFGPHRLDLPAHGRVRREVVFAHQPVVLAAGGGSERVVMALAGELAGRRPGEWSPRFGVVAAAAEVPGPVVVLAHDDADRRRLVRVGRSADRGRVRVVTPAGLADLAEVGVLVRADRRPHPPPLPDRLLVEPQADRRPLLVVDTAGGDDALLGRRAGAYRAAGWVSFEACRGGWSEWERWVHRRRPGRDG